MRVAVDTNVLIYAEGYGDIGRVRRAVEIVDGLPKDQLAISVQACGEFLHVLTKQFRISMPDAVDRLKAWLSVLTLHAPTEQGFEAALDLAIMHKFQLFDAIIVASAAEAECDLLLTEDMQPNFSWRGVTLVNPFASPTHPLIVRAQRSRE